MSGARIVRPAVMLVLAALPLRAGQLAAQARVPELSSLKPAGSPAFVLLGVAPSAIERPTTPTDFGMMLVSRAKESRTVPQDFAAELAPYWLRARRQLTWSDDVRRNVWTSVARTLAVSAATAAIGESEPVAGVSVGARFQLLSGTLSSESQDSLRALEQELAAESGLFQRFLAARRSPIDSVLIRSLREASLITDAAVRQAAQERARAVHAQAMAGLIASVSADPVLLDSIAEGRKRFENIVLERTGPKLEVATATGWAFPGAVWDRGSFDRWGIWASFSWIPSTAHADGPRFTPLVLVRYVAQPSDTLPDFLDVGGRLILSDDRYGISIEAVLRDPRGNLSDDDSLYRVAGVIEYQLRPDTWAVASFGRDHDSAREGSLIAQLGLRLQFAGERYRKP